MNLTQQIGDCSVCVSSGYWYVAQTPTQ